MSSDVVSGEFYHQEKISLEYEKKRCNGWN